jgi:hypothetical protein
MDVATLGLRVDATGAVQQIDNVGRKLDGLAAKGRSAVDSLKGAFLGLSGGAAIGFIGAKILKETVDAQDALAQLEAAYLSTGGAAGRSLNQLDALSKAIAQTSTQSDSAVKGGLSRLLTYTGVQGVMFDRAARAAADMATRLKIDLSSAAEKVGNALNYPSESINSLTKQGFRFTEEQKRMIKEFENTGQIAKAQAIIMGELELAYGGAALAARNTLGGALSNLKNSFGELFEASSKSTGGLVTFINALASATKTIREMSPWITSAAIALGGMATAFGLVKAAAAISGLTQLPILLFSIQAAFTAAAAAGTGLIGVMYGLAPLLAPVALVAGFVLLVATIKNAREETALYQKELDGIEQEARTRAMKAYVQQHRDAKDLGDRLKKFFPDVYRGQGTPKKPDDTKAVEDFRALVAEREADIQKQNALNAAHGKGALALKILDVQFDAHIERLKNARDHTGSQLETLNRLTSAMASARIKALELAEAEKILLERERALADLRDKASSNRSSVGQNLRNALGSGPGLGSRVSEQEAIIAANANSNYKKWADENNTATKRVSELGQAALNASQALESIIISKVGGGGFGSAIGSSVARAGLADATKAGTFASTAVGGAIFGAAASTVGAAIGAGFDAFVKDVFGSDGAKRRAREAFQKAVEDFARSIASANARLHGNSLEADIIDAQQQAADRRKKAEELQVVGGVLGNEDLERRQEEERARQMAEINRLEAEQIRILKERDAEQKRFAKEDLEVRALRAKGQDKEADRLALENRQKQELFEAERAGFDAAYIARLKEVQAMEKSKTAFDELSKSALNMVQGYRYQSTIFKNLTPRDGILPPLPKEYRPEKPRLSSKGESSATAVDGDLHVTVTLPDGSVLGKVVLKDFKKKAQQQYGDSTKWSQVQ